jgi:MFS family permease
MIETEDRAILSGARAAYFTVVGYVAALAIGAFIGGWAAGWGYYGSSWCLQNYFLSILGLGMFWGLVSFVGLGVTTIAYFKLDLLKWECLNALAFLSAINIYVGFGSGEISLYGIGRVPEWRFPASLVAIAIVYVLGRAALILTGRSPLPGSRH